MIGIESIVPSAAREEIRPFRRHDDGWKRRPNLTFNFGLRYENTPPWFDETGRLVNISIPFFDFARNVPDLSLFRI